MLVTWLGCLSLCVLFWVLVLVYAGGHVAFMLLVAGVLFICYLAEGNNVNDGYKEIRMGNKNIDKKTLENRKKVKGFKNFDSGEVDRIACKFFMCDYKEDQNKDDNDSI